MLLALRVLPPVTAGRWLAPHDAPQLLMRCIDLCLFDRTRRWDEHKHRVLTMNTQFLPWLLAEKGAQLAGAMGSIRRGVLSVPR